jgi:hypothetical protein
VDALDMETPDCYTRYFFGVPCLCGKYRIRAFLGYHERAYGAMRLRCVAPLVRMSFGSGKIAYSNILE